VQDADSQSNYVACLLDTVTCFCFAFPFIFCCHACIRNNFLKQKREEELQTLNGVYYAGQPVLSASTNNSVLVNTDYLRMSELGLMENPLNTRPVSMNTNANNGQAMYRRTMTVRIPDGISAGMTISVQSPDGVDVQVLVPEGVTPGQEIEVQY
jgi:hypothetical protein